MYKLIKIIVCTSFVISGGLLHLSYKVDANEDFEINERDYIERCKATNMTKKDTEICSEFNQYLMDKNTQVEENIDSLKSDIASQENQIQQIKATIDALALDIENKEAEMTYVTENINTISIHIQDKETKIRERLYMMQTYMNSNTFFDFIVGATSFSDLFARIDSVNQITRYDKDLIASLANDRESLEGQKSLLESSKASLALMQSEQVAYQDSLAEQMSALVAQVGYLEEEAQLKEEYIHVISSAVDASLVSIAEEEELKRRLEEEAQKNQDNNQNNNQNNNEEGSDENQDGNPSPDIPSDGTLGVRAVLMAMSQGSYKNQSPYVWGGKGQYITQSYISGLASYYGWSWYTGLEPFYDTGTRAFDCSGLTYWSYAQLGIYLGYSTYSQQNNGYAVSWDAMLPGDLILFDWDGDGLTDHVGMYAGDGYMIHTSTPNDGLGVHTINLSSSSTWYNYCATIRRVV